MATDCALVADATPGRDASRIDWRQLELSPSVQTKDGVRRRWSQLVGQPLSRREHLRLNDDQVQLVGRWSNPQRFDSLLSLSLRNTTQESITLTRLVFPTENGLDSFLSIQEWEQLSFLRNGY